MKSESSRKRRQTLKDEKKKKPPPTTMPLSLPRIEDERFAKFGSDPRLQPIHKRLAKTKLDERFSHVLKDKDFTATAKVDKYGRRVEADSNKKALQRRYQVEQEEDNESGSNSNGASDNDSDDEEETSQQPRAKYDPARGGGFSSSSDSDTDSEDDDQDEEIDKDDPSGVAASGGIRKLGQEQANDVEAGEITRRIAIVNLDWDNINSTDLFALLSSFSPAGGKVERVSIYPSEFGKERMQREEHEGPPKEIFQPQKAKAKAKPRSNGETVRNQSDDDYDYNDNSEDDEEEEDEAVKNSLLQEGDDTDFNSDALRSYQLGRLRYYYAVVECSDNRTAEDIYRAVDGREYQASSNFLDLRFVPDDVGFDDEPRDTCSALPANFEPTEFTTDALQHSKVKLTWDVNPEDATRKEKIRKAFSASRSELEENDLRAYLASDSDDEDDDDDDDRVQNDGGGDDDPDTNCKKLSAKELARKKMRDALGLGSEPVAKLSGATGPTGEMEVTFDLDEGTTKKKAKPQDAEETTLEKYMRKERERKTRKKATREGHDADKDATNDNPDQGETKDLGFDDPFFTAEEPIKTKTALRKEERIAKRDQKKQEAEETAKEKVKLEKLMNNGSTDRLNHFDMKEIERTEKLKAKKGKKNKKKEKEERKQMEEAAGGAGGALQQDFQVDPSDNRFTALFEKHEFAIDPSHPSYKATSGMTKVLEYKNKRRGEDSGFSTGRTKRARRH